MVSCIFMLAAKILVRKRFLHLKRRLVSVLSLVGASLLTTSQPLLGAEEIILTYGYFERAISIEELAAFSAGEPLSPQLANYASTFQLSAADLQTIRQVLNEKVDLSPVVLSQFLYTIQGLGVLDTLGEVIQTPARQSGAIPIRAAAVLAAADEAEGLTLINFMRKYPTPGIRFNVRRGLNIASQTTEVLGQSEAAIALVQQLADIEAQNTSADLLPVHIRMQGRPQYTVQPRSLTLPDRGVAATLFLPQSLSPRSPLPETIPVILVSHGLGDQRTSYTYLAEYLAVRGFAVATLDHPGSDGDQITALLSGLSPNLVDDQEFLNRPVDVSAVLDKIERFAQQDPVYQDRLNTRAVGVVGQSFGGYTALALAGATLESEALAAACAPQVPFINPSLLLQCQAEAVAPTAPSLRDERVQAVLTLNPIGSAMFGPAGYRQIDIPVMMVAATADTIAPALPEQIAPFTWLQTQYRYLALAGKTTHFSMIGANPNTSLIPIPSEMQGSSPEIARRYVQALSLMFFQRHLNQNLRYEPALTARYIQDYVESPPLQPLRLIQDLSGDRLNDLLSSAP